MVNQCGYEKFEEMEIDKKRDIYDLSDHCMVRLSPKMKKRINKRRKKSRQWRNTDYHMEE